MSGFIGSTKWKKMMAKIYGIGAAVVIMGAMFKIMHWPGAGPMLVMGLSTEVLIFFFSAFEPLHEEIDWSLVYPELSGIHGENEEDKGTITEQLDNMLEEAKIGPELIASLGEGMKNLSDQAGKLSNISDASVATNEYTVSMKSAASNIGSLSESYSNAAKSLSGLAQSASSAEENSGVFVEQIHKGAKNLSALNASYELQLQGSNEHQKTVANFYTGIADLMKNLNDSVSDTQKYKEQIAQLSSNLESLNTVYGN